MERVVAWINRQPFKEWTKHTLKLTLPQEAYTIRKKRKLRQENARPDEAAWIPLTMSEKDSRVKAGNTNAGRG